MLQHRPPPDADGYTNTPWNNLHMMVLRHVQQVYAHRAMVLYLPDVLGRYGVRAVKIGSGVGRGFGMDLRWAFGQLTRKASHEGWGGARLWNVCRGLPTVLERYTAKAAEAIKSLVRHRVWRYLGTFPR